MRPGIKALLAGNSYQTMDGRIASRLCQALAWPWINALSAVHGAVASEVARAEPPSNTISTRDGTAGGEDDAVL